MEVEAHEYSSVAAAAATTERLNKRSKTMVIASATRFTKF